MFRHFAGVAVVPTVARIVLCLAFIPIGANKIFTTSEFTGAQAQRLIEMGVVAGATERPAAETVAYRQETPSQPPPETGGLVTPQERQRQREQAQAAEEQRQGPVEQAGEAVDETLETVEEAAPDVPEAPEEQAVDPDLVVEARGVYAVALMVDQAGVLADWAVPLAWTAALAEFVGGCLLLIGLFSRLWALGMVVVMGVAFAITTWPVLGEYDYYRLMAFAAADDSVHFNRMFTQLGLGGLALAVVLVGPGPLSLDRLIFRRTRVPTESYSSD